METLNGISVTAREALPHADESVTQSLDQMVKKKLKETAKQLKRKGDDAPAQGLAAPAAQPVDDAPLRGAPLLGPAVRGREQALRLTLNVPAPGEAAAHRARATASSSDDNTRHTVRGTSLPGAAVELAGAARLHGVSPAPTVDSGNALFAVPQRASDARDGALSALRSSEPSPLALSENAERPEGQPRDVSVRNHPASVPSMPNGAASPLPSAPYAAEPMAKGRIRDQDKTALPTIAAEPPRHTASVVHRAETAPADAARPSPSAEAMTTRMMSAAAAEPPSGSKLVYRFAEWGDGHQVNVQLGGQAKAPHVLQVSDTLVHQRLAEYGDQNQGQGDPEWVFSDEQEQPKKERHQQTGEETE